MRRLLIERTNEEISYNYNNNDVDASVRQPPTKRQLTPGRDATRTFYNTLYKKNFIHYIERYAFHWDNSVAVDLSHAQPQAASRRIASWC